MVLGKLKIPKYGQIYVENTNIYININIKYFVFLNINVLLIMYDIHFK